MLYSLNFSMSVRGLYRTYLNPIDIPTRIDTIENLQMKLKSVNTIKIFNSEGFQLEGRTRDVRQEEFSRKGIIESTIKRGLWGVVSYATNLKTKKIEMYRNGRLLR